MRSFAPLAGLPGVLLALLAVAGCQNTDLNGGASLTNDADGPSGPVDECPTPLSVPVLLNEVMLVNTSSVPGPGGVFLPWVELYNPSVDEFDLGGTLLTDDLAVLEKWEFPCGPDSIIGPGEFRVFFFSDENLDPLDDLIDFLPDTMGPVTLYLNGVNTIDTAEIEAEDLDPEMTSGRTPDGEGDFVALLVPTPGAANSEPLVAPPAAFVRGDIDADGDVDLDDLDLLVTIVFEGTGTLPACEDRLDVNDDGVIDVADPNFLAIALDPGGPSIPAPFPGADVDPTPDGLPCENEVAP